jgi:hypothetical protein
MTFFLERSFYARTRDGIRMHDYDDHSKTIHLCFDIKKKIIQKTLTKKAKKLVAESLEQQSPSQYLIEKFKLCGFFRF